MPGVTSRREWVRVFSPSLGAAASLAARAAGRRRLLPPRPPDAPRWPAGRPRGFAAVRVTAGGLASRRGASFSVPGGYRRRRHGIGCPASRYGTHGKDLVTPASVEAQ